MVELDTDVVRPGDKRTRGQHRLYQPSAKLSIYKNSFFPRIIGEWNLLLTSVTDATTIEELRVGLGHALPTLYTAVILPRCLLTVYTMRGSRKFCQRGPTFTKFFFVLFLVDEGKRIQIPCADPGSFVRGG